MATAPLPFALGDPREAARRQLLLGEPHMQALAHHCRLLRSCYPEREVPDLDPLDGGNNARALLLLEAPGPKALRTGFVSRDSPDLTARHLLELCWQHGIAREDTAVWNVVPWYLGDGKRIRAARAADLSEAEPWLRQLLKLLPRLERLLLVGRKAQAALPQLSRWCPLPCDVCPHMSPQVFHIKPGLKAQTEAAFARLGLALAGKR